MVRRLVVVFVAIAAMAGCGKSEQQKQAEQIAEAAKQVTAGAEQAAKGAQAAAQGAATASDQLAQGLSQFAKGLGQMAQSSAPAVDYEKLKGLIPEIAGWTRSAPRGEQVTAPFKMSKAEARYEKGGSSIKLEIADSSFNQLILAPLSMFMAMGFEEKSDDGYTKATKISGLPGFEKWQHAGKDGEVTVVVANRFIVNADGNNVENIDIVRKAVQAVDLSKLAGMK